MYDTYMVQQNSTYYSINERDSMCFNGTWRWTTLNWTRTLASHAVESATAWACVTPVSSGSGSIKVNTLKPRRNGRHFADGIFKCFKPFTELMMTQFTDVYMHICCLRMTHICVSKIDHYWIRWWLAGCPATNYYLNWWLPTVLFTHTHTHDIYFTK